jgi:uncharacterized protein DUF6958
MEKIQLVHPEGKKAPTMARAKYEILSTAFLACLKKRRRGTFQELEEDVAVDLQKRKQTPEGKLGWSLFWVSLDLEAHKLIGKDRSTSPIQYSLSK